MAFEYNFVTEPDDSLRCLICLEVATDPKQHGNCGRLFCSACIKKNENQPCPNCRAEKPQYFMDTRSLRETKALLVRCANVKRGCVWEGSAGTLGSHVTKCGYTLVFCSSRCKVEGKEVQMMKKDLDNHMKTECPNRKYQCENCQKKGTYDSITKVHDAVCIKKVVSCPNSKCTLTMERGLTKRHLQTVCDYTVIDCKYASIGCRLKMMRMDMKLHEEVDKSHLPLLLKKIEMLDKMLSSSKNEISSLKKTIFSLLSDISSMKASTSSLKATMSSQKAAISSLEGTTFSLVDATSFLEETTCLQKATISTLEATTSSHKATISSLKATTSALKDTTSSHKATISSLKATTSALKDTTSSQMANISSLKASTSALKVTTASQKAAISSLEVITSCQGANMCSLEDTTSILKASISVLEESTSSRRATISSLVDTTSVLKKNIYTSNREKCITFNLPGYSKKKEDSRTFYSESFYSSPGGYRMCIRVDPRGTSGEGTHVSVFSQLVYGSNDDNLTWPFLGSVTVELLNQLADANHHSMVIPFLTIHNSRIGSAWGYDKFLSHDELFHDSSSNTQYLMSDTLYFRVAVEVDNHKPWLDCTHHTL